MSTILTNNDAATLFEGVPSYEGFLNQIVLTDSDSLRLEPCRTLGEPLGCLKIAPGKLFANVEAAYQPIVAAVTTLFVVGILNALTINFLPTIVDLNSLRVINRNFTNSQLLMFIVPLESFGIAFAICNLRLKYASTLEVYEYGFRFSSSKDKINGPNQIRWRDVDTSQNHVDVEWAFAMGRKSRIATRFRLRSNSISRASHEIQLIVDTQNKEINVAKFLCERLGCRLS